MPFVATRSSRLRGALAALLAIFAGCTSVDFWRRPLTTAEVPQPWPRPDLPGELDLEEIRAQLLELHNRARREKKKSRLSISEALQDAAQAHAEEMAERHQMTHDGADGSNVADRISTQGYSYRRCGENIAYGRYSPERVMRGWLTSPPHRKNILGGYSQIGLGYATGKDGTPYWCVTFGLPSGR